MADLVIRGMEMPQRCKACRFCGFGGRRSELNVCMFTGESQPKLSQERMSKCPLVPLPEGHGRLIDANELETTVIDAIEEGFNAADILLDIRFAPTIVPKEGGTDNGN